MLGNKKLKEFANVIGYTFKDEKLLKNALTHKSYAYERKHLDMDSYNERLEFLGDAVLQQIITEHLFFKRPILAEGVMTKKRAEIVCEKALSKAFQSIKGEKYIFLGKCELVSKGRNKDAIIADAMEAVIGAIYLDSDIETTREVVLKLLKNQIISSLNGKMKITDYKTVLQELLQKDGYSTVKYKVTNEIGPPHEKYFFVDVLCNNNKVADGSGKSIKQAEQMAAKDAYMILIKKSNYKYKK